MPHPALGNRSLFPSLEVPFYLNHAAVGPLPETTVRAVTTVVQAQAALGVGAIGPWVETMDAAKRDLASLIAGRAEEIALTTNTTHGVQGVAMSLDWAEGDGILLFDGEFPTNVTPWQRAAELFNLTLHFAPIAGFHGTQGEGLAHVERLLRDHKIRLLAVSAVQFQTGLRMPLRELATLAHRYGAELFVDGIQAVGAVPVDVVASDVDYLACGGHKWLMGPPGSGFLWAKASAWEKLVPRLSSWLSHNDPFAFLERPHLLNRDQPLSRGPSIVTGGMAPYLAAAGLGASAALLTEIGVDNIFTHIQAYHDRLEECLDPGDWSSVRHEDPSRRSGLLCFKAPERADLPDTLLRASNEGISLATPDGHLRISPAWSNPFDEIGPLAQRLQPLLSRRG